MVCNMLFLDSFPTRRYLNHFHAVYVPDDIVGYDRMNKLPRLMIPPADWENSLWCLGRACAARKSPGVVFQLGRLSHGVVRRSMTLYAYFSGQG